jgi:phenylacetate-CoA ligase
MALMSTPRDRRVVAADDARDGIWNPAMETLPRAALRALQGDLLREQVAYVFERAPFFREHMQSAGVRPADISGLDDLRRLPLITKDDMRRWGHEHGDLFAGTACVPPTSLHVVNHSTGTSGQPTVYGLTPNDLGPLGEIFARALWCIGLRPGDRTPMSGMGFWHGWVIGFEVGARRIGAVPYRLACSAATCVEAIFTQWTSADFTALRAFIPELELEFFERTGIRPRDVFPNARFVYGGFDVSGPKRRLIEQLFELPFHNTVGSGDQYFIGGECEHSAPAHHMPEDFFIFEVLDPFTGQPVPSGGVGELVITNLWAEGFPYLRYRMEDMVTFETDPCACGRTSMRMRVLGRLSWSVQVDSGRVFSSQVEDVVWQIPELLGARYQLVRRREQPQATLEVNVGPTTPIADHDVPRLRQQVEAGLNATFHVPSRVTFLDPQAVQVEGIKMARVVFVE